MKTITLDAFQGKPDVKFNIIGTFDEGLVLKLADKRFSYMSTYLHFTQESADVPLLEHVHSQNPNYLNSNGQKCWMLKTDNGIYIGTHTSIEDDECSEE